jgi:hypothetical protein
VVKINWAKKEVIVALGKKGEKGLKSRIIGELKDIVLKAGILYYI